MKIYNERAMLEAIEFYELFNEFELAQEIRSDYESLKRALKDQKVFKFKNLLPKFSIDLNKN